MSLSAFFIHRHSAKQYRRVIQECQDQRDRDHAELLKLIEMYRAEACSVADCADRVKPQE